VEGMDVVRRAAQLGSQRERPCRLPRRLPPTPGPYWIAGPSRILATAHDKRRTTPPASTEGTGGARLDDGGPIIIVRQG
jgi:hypothetical protein